MIPEPALTLLARKPYLSEILIKTQQLSCIYLQNISPYVVAY